MEETGIDVSLEKAVEYNDWLETEKWLKSAMPSSGIIGKMVSELWEFEKG